MSVKIKYDTQKADIAIQTEFLAAMRKFPNWSHITLPRMALILAEECGEAVQAINDYLEKQDVHDIAYKADMEHFLTEVAQVGGVARRILCEMDVRRKQMKSL